MASRRSHRPPARGARRAARLRRVRRLLRRRRRDRSARCLPVARRPPSDPLRRLALGLERRARTSRSSSRPQRSCSIHGRGRSTSRPYAARHARRRRHGRHDGALRSRGPLAAGGAGPAPPALGGGGPSTRLRLPEPLRRPRRSRRNGRVSACRRTRDSEARGSSPSASTRRSPTAARTTSEQRGSAFGSRRGPRRPRSCGVAGRSTRSRLRSARCSSTPFGALRLSYERCSPSSTARWTSWAARRRASASTRARRSKATGPR